MSSLYSVGSAAAPSSPTVISQCSPVDSTSRCLSDFDNNERKTVSVGVQTDVAFVHAEVRLIPFWLSTLSPFDPSILTLSSSTPKHAADAHVVNKERRPFPLYRDVLQIVFRYLSLSELSIAIRLSKQWLDSLTLLSSLGICTASVSPENLSSISPSSIIARHVAEVSTIQKAYQYSHSLTYPGFNILPHLKIMLPNLTALSIHTQEWTLDLPRVDASWMPPLLKSLQIGIGKANHAPPIFTAVSQLAHLQDLTFHIQALDVDYSPLLPLAAQLQRVAVFSTKSWIDSHDLDSVVRFIRQTRVRTLVLDATFIQTAIKLLQRDPQHPASAFPLLDSGSLTSITTVLTHETLKCLAQYPSLSHIESNHTTFKELSETFPRLTSLSLSKAERMFSQTINSTIISACQRLPLISSLSVSEHWRFSTTKLDEILCNLPNLKELALWGSREGVSLAPLIGYGLPHRLTKLVLRYFFVHCSDLLEYILRLEKLEELVLEEVCTGVIPDRVKQQVSKMTSLKKCELIHGEPAVSSSAVRKDINTEDEAYAYVVDPSARGTRTTLFHIWAIEHKPRDYYSNQYSLEYLQYQNICAMKEYRHKSLEELRLEDEEIGLENPPNRAKQPTDNGDDDFSSSITGEDNGIAASPLRIRSNS